ncbi:hypothetical protein E1264_12105 [Actinomadura sp. KC216]|uniref:hypothetical protein n=1 Tax=Actinomadura sp. KC216 TaxID=2530370 RepID=UPI001043E8EC|nr:hypothetical protein [Actinomadura sp. KC216]TDB88226.1 hypothetical protein E1264_12105 [Actinomadura sp. KC216]
MTASISQGRPPLTEPQLTEPDGPGPPGCSNTCRGRYRVFAPDAVRALHEHGRPARLLAGGMPAWRRAGLSIATGTRS